MNDTRGHQAGDELLISITDTVREFLKTKDCVFRMSSDEFVVLFDGADFKTANSIMLKVLRTLKVRGFGDKAFCYGVSVRERGDLTSTPRGLFAEADASLYLAKRKYYSSKTGLKAFKREITIDESKEFNYSPKLLYDALSSCTEDYMFVCNMKTGIMRYSDAIREDFNIPNQLQVDVQKLWKEKVYGDDLPALFNSSRDIDIGYADTQCVEFRMLNRYGEWEWLRRRGKMIRDENGEPTLFAGFITNLGKQNRMDNQTGFMNKLAFRKDCEKLLENGGVTMMIFDIDDLEKINALYSYEFGDEVVRIVGQRIKSLLPKNATIYRLDGDEFGVLIKGKSKSGAQACYTALKRTYNVQQLLNGVKYYCTISCGAEMCDDVTEDYDEIHKRAEYALFTAKKRGKNRLEFFSTDMLESIDRKFVLTELIRESIENGFKGFYLEFQPIFCKRARLCGAETLTRFVTPQGEIISPAEFIPILEGTKLIIPVGKWIIQTAFMEARTFWEKNPEFRLNVNLSWTQLGEPDIVHWIESVAKKENAPTDKIVLELTESCFISDYTDINALLTQLKNAGFRISIDDFGSVYSSFGRLQSVPVDEVKIDMLFAHNIHESKFNRAFLRHVVELCHIVGTKVCLEGVEIEDEYSSISAFGLDYLQGFLFGKPCKKEDFVNTFLNEKV